MTSSGWPDVSVVYRDSDSIRYGEPSPDTTPQQRQPEVRFYIELQGLERITVVVPFSQL